MSIRAITFDFWGTLFRDVDGEARQQMRIEALAHVARVSLESAADALKLVWNEFNRCHKQEQRTLTPADAVRLATGSLDVTLRPAAARKLAHTFGTAVLTHSPEPIKGALEAVRAAAKHGPIALISDTGISPGTSLQKLMDRFGFTESFNVLTFSDVVGVSKPQAPMFERTAVNLGVAPSELLHIGDLEGTDIAGALAIGAKAALFVGENDASQEGTRAHYVFHSWREFVALLPQLAPED